MSHSPFRKFGRYLLAACAVSLGVASLNAQDAPPAAPAVPAKAMAAPGGPNPSRVDIFMGYSYFGAHGTLKPFGTRYGSVDEGAAGSVAYYFNKYVGGEILAVANPNGNGDGFYTYSAGPIFRAPMQNFTLFAHGLAGGVRGTGPDNDNPSQFQHNPYTWGVGLTAGGGMDYDLPFFNHAFGLRLFQADYVYKHIDFGPPVASIPNGGQVGGRANLGGVELSTGILLHVGHILPPTPIAYACSVTQPTGTIYPGDAVEITGTATNLNPKKDAKYTWMSDAGPIPSTSNVASVDTKSLAPNTYKVTGHATQGNKPYEMADCTASFTVTQFQPPTVSCTASPSTVNPGQSATVTATGNSPQNRPLTYSYSATAGSISGNTGTATLDTTGVAPGSVSITCNVVDDKGQTASAMTTVSVNAPPPPPKPATKDLCSISFDRDEKRPTRVNNEAKACLDDIALAAQSDPSSKLIVTGNSDPSEKMAEHKAAERAVNEKAYLVGEKGIDASRITVYTGSAGSRTAATTLVPTGADMPSAGTPVDEAAIKAIPRTAPAPRGRKHHKAAHKAAKK